MLLSCVVVVELVFSLAFTIGSVVFTVMSLVWGVVLDCYGIGVCHLGGCALVLLGSLLLIPFDSRHFDSLLPAMACISAGGPGIYTALLNMSKISRLHGSLMVASISASFDASAFMGVILTAMADATSRQLTFAVFAAVVGASMLLSGTVWSTRALHSLQHDLQLEEAPTAAAVPLPQTEQTVSAECQEVRVSAAPSLTAGGAEGAEAERSVVVAIAVSPQEGELESSAAAAAGPCPSPTSLAVASASATGGNTPSASVADTAIEPVPVTQETEVAVPVPVQPIPLTFLSIVRSWHFISLCLIICVFYLRVAYYYGSVSLQLAALAGASESEVSRYTFLFTLLVSVLAFTAPLIGLCEKRYGIAAAFTVAQGLLLVFSVTCLLPVLPLQLVSFILIGCCRAWTYPVLFFYLEALFGFVHMGKAYGLCILLAGGCSALQYPLIAASIAQGTEGFRAVSIGLAVATLLCFLLILSMFKHPLLKQARTIAPANTTTQDAQPNANNPPLPSSTDMATIVPAPAAAAAAAAVKDSHTEQTDAIEMMSPAPPTHVRIHTIPAADME